MTTPLALATVHWWGPRVLPGVFAGSLMHIHAAGNAPLAWYPIAALPEPVMVLLSYAFFNRILFGSCWLPDLKQSFRFLLFGACLPVSLGIFQSHAQDLLVARSSLEQFRISVLTEWSASLCGILALTVPLLHFLSAPLERRGWSRTIGASNGRILPRRISSMAMLETVTIPSILLFSALLLPASSALPVFALILTWAALRRGSGFAIFNSMLVILVFCASNPFLPVGAATDSPLAAAVQQLGIVLVASAGILAGAAISSLIHQIRSLQFSQKHSQLEENRAQELTDTLPQLFYLHQIHPPRTLYVNRRFEAIWGRKVEDLYRNPHAWSDAIERDGDDPDLEMDPEAGEWTLSYRVIRPDGTSRNVVDHGFPIRDEEGNIIRIAGMIEDVTRRPS